MNAPDLSALAAYAGKYEKRLFSTLVNELDAISDVTLIPDLKNKLNMTKLTAGNGARPYSSVFQGGRGNDLKYTGRVLEVHMGKRDLTIEPYLYRPTWMSEVMRPGVNPDDIPFAGYVWERVMAELAAEINDKTIYFGFNKATATAYSGAATYAPGNYITFTATDGITDYWKCLEATTAGQTPVTHPAKWQEVNAEAICEGFAAKIAAAIAGSDLAPVSTGAITSSDAYDQYTSVWRALPIPYKKRGAILFSSWSNVDFLHDDFEDKVSKYTEKDNSGNIYLAKTDKKCRLVRATWMTGSGRLICTPKENLLIGTDRISDMNKIITDVHLRTLDAGIDFALGTQIRDLAAMVVNNVA